eukprot:1093389-Amorphochlora_amoeboformis.AAC.1
MKVKTVRGRLSSLDIIAVSLTNPNAVRKILSLCCRPSRKLFHQSGTAVPNTTATGSRGKDRDLGFGVDEKMFRPRPRPRA